MTGTQLSTGERWAEGLGPTMSFIPIPGMKHVGKYGTDGAVNLWKQLDLQFFAGKRGRKVETYEQVRNEALSWLEQRGFKSQKQTFGKFGYTKNEPIGRQTNDGKVGFRIEYDSRSGAHINVWAGKEKGPHFEFDASEKTVKKIQKRFR